ncbi:unnamed protein product [Closterium sp. NIES-53]
MGRLRRPPKFFVPAAFTTVYDVDADDLAYDDAEDNDELTELDPDMHANPNHCWDILTMTVKEALASWKGVAVKAAMEEEIRSLIGMGTWELVERPPGVNIMKNCYITLRIFLSIIAVLNLNLMQLDMKNAFLQSKLDRLLYMYLPDYFNDRTDRVCKLLKSLYGLEQSPLLWYKGFNDVLIGTGRKKSQVYTVLYFKVGTDKMDCWALVSKSSTLEQPPQQQQPLEQPPQQQQPLEQPPQQLQPLEQPPQQQPPLAPAAAAPGPGAAVGGWVWG